MLEGRANPPRWKGPGAIRSVPHDEFRGGSRGAPHDDDSEYDPAARRSRGEKPTEQHPSVVNRHRARRTRAIRKGPNEDTRDAARRDVVAQFRVYNQL